MILVSVLRTERGFLTRLGLGVVLIPDETTFRHRLGLHTGREQKIKSSYGEIQKISENNFLVKIKATDGRWTEKIYKTFEGATGRLSAVQWVAG